MKTKILALLLALLMLAGCTTSTPVTTPPDIPATTQPEPSTEPAETVIPAENVPTPDIFTNLGMDGYSFLDICPFEDGYCVLANHPTNLEVILTLDRDFQVTEIMDFQPEFTLWENQPTPDRAVVTCIAVFGSNRYTAADRLLEWDIYCNETLLYTVPRGHAAGPTQLAVEDGHVFFLNGGLLTCDGEPVTMPEMEDENTDYYLRGIIALNGKVYVEYGQTYLEPGRPADEAELTAIHMVPVDAERKTLQEENAILHGLPFVCGMGLNCADGEKLYFLDRNSVLETTDAKTSSRIMNLSARGVDTGSLCKLEISHDGRLIVLQEHELSVLNLDGNLSDECISLGILDTAPDEALISAYNRTRQGKRVVLEYFDNREQLYDALHNGEVDMVQAPCLDILQTAALHGLLAPINEAAPELFEDGVLLDAADLFSINGTTYYLPTTFFIGFSQLHSDYAGGRERLESWNDFLSCFEEHPELYRSETAENVLYYLSHNYADCWYDAQTNTADFDSALFIAFLEFCNRFCKNKEDVQQLTQGRSAFYPSWDAREPSYLRFAAEYDPERNIGPYISFPMPLGDAPGYAMTRVSPIAIANGPNQNECGSFIAWMLTSPEGLHYWVNECVFAGFPITTAGIELMRETHLDDAMNPPDTRYYTEGFDPVENCRQDLAAMDTALANLRHIGTSYANEWRGLIYEEGMKYLNGECTAQEAAAMVQNKVSIRLSEIGF